MPLQGKRKHNFYHRKRWYVKQYGTRKIIRKFAQHNTLEDLSGKRRKKANPNSIYINARFSKEMT